MAKASKSDHLKTLQEVFNRFDHDSDGRLTQLELAAFLRSLGLKPTPDKLHDLLSNMDSNGNGKIQFDEIINVLASEMNDAIDGARSSSQLINEDQLLEVFRSFDRDGNGFISRTELAKAMKRVGHPMTYKELVSLMNEADTDGDGFISFSEFGAIMHKSAAEFFDLR